MNTNGVDLAIYIITARTKMGEMLWNLLRAKDFLWVFIRAAIY